MIIIRNKDRLRYFRRLFGWSEYEIYLIKVCGKDLKGNKVVINYDC